MADTVINSVKDARFSLSTRDIFFQMKADQKAAMAEPKTCETSIAYKAALEAWHSKKPAEVQSTAEWRQSQPRTPIILRDGMPRHLNIIYGMLRGRAYREIEQTYREHNGPCKNNIMRVLEYYNIDPVAFTEVCGEIDYE